MSELKNEIIETGEGLKNGQQFCPNCGSTQTYYDPKIGKLKCPICESEFDGKKYTQTDTRTLNKNIIGSGAKNINEEFNDLVTIKCNGCGAEIVFDTSKATQKKCHWCGGILSINERIENGTVPDVILPFIVTKEQAYEEMKKYLKDKRKYVRGTFKKNFKIENITGVYLPYLLIDANTRCYFEGEGEHQTAQYEHKLYGTIRYNSDVYKIKRIFDLEIEDLTIEASIEKVNKNKKHTTNNIINSIMPFDTKNCIKFESSYLTNFTSEKRNINIDELNKKVETEIKDIARHKLNKTILDYDRGIKWTKEKVNIKGMRWISAYLPVWIYSYYDKKKTHYVAVNGRTRETAGSTPMDRTKLFAVYGGLVIILILIVIFLEKKYPGNSTAPVAAFMLVAFLIRYYKQTCKEYKNLEARHKYEKETKTVLTMFLKEDEYIDNRKKQKNYEIKGKNNKRTDGEDIEIEHKQKHK